MKLTSRSLTHQMTYIAIMSAITIVLSVLTNFFPLTSILLILFLPFVASLVAIICDLKLFPIYLVSSILLSAIVDMANFFHIIFYLLPALVSGFVIGVLYRGKVNGIYILLLVSLVNLLSNYAIIPVLDALYEIDFINYSLGLFGFKNHPHASAIFMMFLYVVGIIQATITYIIVSEEIYIIKGKIVEDYDQNSVYIMAILSISTLVFGLFHLGLALVSLGSLFFLSVYQFIFFYQEDKKLFYTTLVLVGVSTIISFVLAELHRLEYLPIYLILPVLIVVITRFLWEYILKQRKQ